MSDRILGRTEEYYDRHGALQTAAEISWQPRLWRETAALLKKQGDEIRSYMSGPLATRDLRIIFAGAGSSAFIGDSLSAILARSDGICGESIATTDIVSAPDNHLHDVPTLLVSYSRSGGSPESEAAIRYAKERITELYNIVLVCKEDSELAAYASGLGNALVLRLPPESSDKGFAMTASVSCMALATFALFGPDDLDGRMEFIEKIADWAEAALDRIADTAREVASFENTRLIFLGSGGLKGLAHEASIKSLELTMGRIVAGYESPMGFRHGPKAALNERSLTVIFISPLYPARNYDIDVTKELIREKNGDRVAVVAPTGIGTLEGADYQYGYDIVPGNRECLEMNAYIAGLLFSQIFALEKSINKELKADDPCDSGNLNRVVRGVVIYPIDDRDEGAVVQGEG
jgi:tagatose-6-phosphate ketose/aldose isomerase